MTELPPDELAALPEHIEIGTTVLELGNKKNVTGLYRNWYIEQGLNYECVDWNGEDGAYNYDMRIPDGWRQIAMDLNDGERFQLVTNFGFTEHVGETYEEQIECWRNVHDLVAVDGVLAICMPLMPWWKGHGRWMPDPGWYDSFASLNDYSIEMMRVWDRVRPTCVARMIKRQQSEFRRPTGAIARSD